MLVRIISGTYGHRPKLANGEYSRYVMPVNRNDLPIDVDAEEAARLVRKGIAAYVDAVNATGAVATALSDDFESSAIDNSSDDEGSESGDLDPGETTGHFAESDLNGMTYAALKKLASDLGIDTSKNATKRNLIARICAEEVKVPSEAVALGPEDVVE